MKDAKIIGIPLPLYLAIGVLLTVAMYVGALPGDFTGAFAIAVYWGSLFMWLGAKIPIVNTYMGGQILLPLVACSLMSKYGFLRLSFFYPLIFYLCPFRTWQHSEWTHFFS